MYNTFSDILKLTRIELDNKSASIFFLFSGKRSAGVALAIDSKLQTYFNFQTLNKKKCKYLLFQSLPHSIVGPELVDAGRTTNVMYSLKFRINE